MTMNDREPKVRCLYDVMHDVIGVVQGEAGGADVVVDERIREEAEEAADLFDPVDAGLWRAVRVGRG